jgi:ATP-binding cassette subfamily F protein 3
VPVLTAHNLSKSYGAEDIFSGITFSVPHRARIGLVGANGVGKTTLLRILLGMEEPSAGSIHLARGARLGYLPQEAGFDSALTLWDEMLKTFSDLLERQAELTRLEEAMRHPGQAEAALVTYGTRQHEFDLLGGYTYEQRIHQTLTGLGFSRADELRPVSQLSGGQRTRARLAQLLLSNPDLLLLDEPTNHLDIEAIEWLEKYFSDWQGAVFIVSHDRYFLDRVVDHVYEMTPALEIYRGNYSAYIHQRSERYQRRLAEYQEQQEFIEKEEDYIRRNIAGQNTSQAKGRLKRLERMLEETRLAPPRQSRKLSLKLQAGGRSGDLVIRTRGLQVGYADEGHPLFTAPDLVLERGECAAIIGPNGAGKTTFLKTLLGLIPPYAGEAQLGASLKVSYFAQAHELLHEEWTLMDEISTVAVKMQPGEIRDYLAKFLFTGDDVFKTVSVLSGGERGRLALALLALQGANLLLLDEPTNHLDIPAQEVLQSILADFRGTILLVSHDRYLIDALATQVWEVLPEGRSLKVFDGTYSEYKQVNSYQLSVNSDQLSVMSSQASGEKKLRPEKNQKSLSKDKARRREARLSVLEEQVSALEEQMAVISRQLESGGVDLGKVHGLGREYVRLQGEMDALLNEWEKLSEEVAE